MLNMYPFFAYITKAFIKGGTNKNVHKPEKKQQDPKPQNQHQNPGNHYLFFHFPLINHVLLNRRPAKAGK